MAVTLAEANTYLDAWVAAQAGLARNSSYTLSFPNGQSRTLTRADGEECRRQITYWHRVINSLTAHNAGNSNPGVSQPSWS